MQKIKDVSVRFTSSDSKSKLEHALNKGNVYKNEDLKLSVMTKQETDYPATKARSIIEEPFETDRFDASFRNYESGYQSPDGEFHWMAHASYNLSKLEPELFVKTTKK